MLWEKLRNTKAVQDALYNWRPMDVPETKGIKGFWQKLPKSVQASLASRVIISVDAPTDWGTEYLVYYESAFKELRNCPTASARKQYIQSQIISAEEEQDAKLLDIRFRMINDALYSYITLHCKNKDMDNECKELYELKENAKKIHLECVRRLFRT